MKKFIVSILGIFILFGACLLSACGKTNPSMTLSQDTVAIQLYSEDEDSSFKIVTAQLSGVKDGSVTATAVGGYENIINVSTTRLSDTKFQIKIEGLEEGDAEIVVKGTPGNIQKKIYVNVFSEVSSMTQKEEIQVRKDNFLIRGTGNKLIETKLISFLPSDKSRRTITWTLASDMLDIIGLELEKDVLTISDEFKGNEVKLVATTEKGVFTNITLPVIDKIEEDINLSFSYSQNQDFQEINDKNNKFNIVPNIPSANEYQGYIAVDFNGTLDITPYVTTKDGRPSDDIQVLRHGTIDNKPLFIVYASKDKSNINKDYLIGFEVGYSNYNYFVDTMELNPIIIQAREMVNGITISTEGTSDVKNTIQTLYTTYVDGKGTSINGQRFDVSITPTTVIDASNKYSINISRTVPEGGVVADGCPVEVWYRDEKNGNVWTQAILQENPENGDYFTSDANMLTAKTIYLKAGALREQIVTGYTITFTSQDNKDVSTSFNLRLVKSATLNDFGFNNAEFRVDSSKNQATYSRQLKLKGQTTIDGLSIVNGGKYVNFDAITEVEHDEESVTFEVSFTLLPSSYGVTAVDKYQIVHSNGLASNSYNIDIFLPLKDAAMYVDVVDEETGEYSSNSIIDSELSNKLYNINGTQISGSHYSSLSKLIVKNNKTTPISYTYNSVNGISAVANISVGFFDFNAEQMALDEFKNLMNSEDGAVRVIRTALDNSNSSNIAFFSSNNKSIITKGEGSTYAVVAFTGKGVENADENGNVTFIRVIYIESLVVPESMNVYPDANKNVSIFSNDTVSDEDKDLTYQTINIKFAKDGITHAAKSNIEFVTNKMGRQIGSAEDGIITWENGRYSVEQISISQEEISFNIVSISNFDSHIFTDTLFVHYVIYDDNGDKLYDISEFINITIRNAQRIESLKLKNYDADGLYFEVNDTSAQYLLLESNPTNSRNKNIAHILTDENGNLRSFVNVSDSISANTLAINLAKDIKDGMKGYIYLLPSDAIYGKQVKYYYMDENGQEQFQFISTESIPANYDMLIQKAYFKSNVSIDKSIKVYFSEILIKLPVTIADGKSFDYAYRIYDNNSFLNMRDDRYYTVMNNLDLSRENRNAIVSFKGGLQGLNSNITIKLNGKNFAQKLEKNAVVKNITFIGDVSGSGFVCDENSGSILNVTIDTNGRRASLLTSNYNAGGIAGINAGTIDGGRVLGLTITGNNYVGGIAAVNNSVIKNSVVEFYNLEAGTETESYQMNTFTGLYVGGLVGQMGGNSQLLNSYAYDYSMAKEDRDNLKVLKAVNNETTTGQVGAFAGAAASSNFVIDYSFAVLNIENAVAGVVFDENSTMLNNCYISYYDGVTYTSTQFGATDGFVFEGPNFKQYVNKGQPHLKDLMQDEFVSNVNYSVDTYKSINGYYNSLKVDSNNGILFNYALKDEIGELTTSELKDLNALNTISLTDLIGADKDSFNNNIIVSSSNSSVVKIVGSDLQILKTGSIKLTLASKHDVSLLKEINIKVVYALSDIMISWIDSVNRVDYVVDNSIITLQKTRSRAFITTLEKSQIFIGTLASAYELKVDENITLDIINSSNSGLAESEELVAVDDVSFAGFKVSASDRSVLTNFKVAPKIFDEAIFQNAVKEEFTRNFDIRPVEGVISFDISNKTLAITPSTNASQKVEIKTTNDSDSIYPVISYDGERLISSTLADDKNVLLYTLNGQDKAILKAFINKVGISENTDKADSNLKTYVYDVIFEINDEYRALVSQDMDFDVFFMSDSGNSSEEWGGTFTLALSRQKFNNIDVSNKKIKGSFYRHDSSNNIIEVHEVGNETSVLAPSNSSILQINVNPEFAYYDYVELSYSEATVSEAVNIEVMQRYDDSNTLFKRRNVGGGDIEEVGPVLRFYPKADEKGTLYYKLWINSTINKDSTLKFTAKFFDSNSNLIHFVNYFMTISYLAEPTITIDGANTAYIAKGAKSNVKIEVFADQTIDNLTLEGNTKGVSLSSLSKPVIDEVRGIKIYTATLYAFPDATAESDVFYIGAQVSRELNGFKEIKTVVSTAILVDFKVDGDNITINGNSEKNITIWQGVPKPINIEYNLIPEDYDVASTPEIEKAISELRKKRDLFSGAQYYPAKVDGEGSDKVYTPVENDELKKYNYFVNYKYVGENKDLQVQNLLDRLYFVNGNERISIKDNTIDKPFEYNFDEKTNSISFTGTKINTSVVLALKTYISAGGNTQDFETLFTINIDAYSDPDLPLLIKNAADFKKLNPSNFGENSTAHDYILTNDIILENFTPFDSSAINSFDGNGHTIYIKSYNVSNSNSTALNLALFNNVTDNTILKNVRVNLYNGGQITVDTFKFKDINIAGLAITNSGIITNCEVVSFYTDKTAMGEVDLLNYPATVKHNLPEGINVKYTNGENEEAIYLNGNTDDWSTQIAGLVLNNNGSITNSRVGGDSIVVIGDERNLNNSPTGETYATNQKLGVFNIIGQGNMAGLVLNNTNGNIASSFVKKIDMENQSDTTKYYTSGFVGINNSTINVSYVEGLPSSPDMPEYSDFAYEGSSIKSKKGYVVGFVYQNEGKINDCYSNVLIANSNSETSVYLASGFVYENRGIIENAYSASQIENSMNTQMNFSGVNSKGELLVEGEYINCYFFNKAYEDTEESTDNTTETQNKTGAVLIPTPDKESLFYGFAIASGANDGIWKVVKDQGIFLVSTDNVSVSHRYILYVENDGFEGVTGEDEKGKYILPYSTLVFTDTSIRIDTSLGGENNPIIITDAEDFVSVSGTSTSSYIREYFNSTVMWGTYRIVDNINLSDIANGDNVTVLPSSSKAFAGTLYGNGFTISGLSLATEERGVALGLFRSIEKRGRGAQPVVKNLNISLNQVDGSVVTMAGALAGYIKDSVVVGINVSFEENAILTGYNFAGGLAGFVIGDNTIKGIKVQNPNVIARTYLSDNTTDDNFFVSDEANKGPGSLQALRTDVGNNLNYNTNYSSSLIASLENYSYAGGVLGFVDNYRVNLPAFDINQSENFNIKNIRVSGTIYIEGQVVGGAFGLVGYQTIIRDVGVTIDGTSKSHIIATKYFAGGVIGQSFGSLNRIFADHDATTQDSIENNMSKFYLGDNSAPRGILDIFYLEGKNYSQRYIGGLVGVAYSGSMVISYSKLNVASPTTDYAGGVIGGLILKDTSPYQITVYENADYYTKYYMNEVYAIGDVRARSVTPEHEGDLTYAGGIVGQILGEASRVVMMSVNAFNYITTYNYQTKTYQAITDNQTNISQIYRVNFIVGQFAKIGQEGKIELDNVIYNETNNKNDYKSYINLVEFFDNSYDASSGGGEKYLPSIGVFESYYKNSKGGSVSLNLFGNIDARDENVFEKEGLGECYYLIESPRSYENSSVGWQYTNAGFLGSGVWNMANWEHDMNKLFPSIKYKRTSDVLYLDQYNVEEIFSKMQGTNATVYIRGLESKGSEVYGHIDLREYFEDHDTVIRRFAGKLVGGVYEVAPGEPVKIISDRNFIESVSIGFKVENVEVDYQTANGTGEIVVSIPDAKGKGGLFVLSDLDGCEIDGLTLNVDSPVIFKVSASSTNTDIGLVAANIANTNISRLKINSKKKDGYLVTIEEDGNFKNPKNGTLNAGLIAGRIELTDTALASKNIQVENIEIPCDIMTIIDGNYSIYNVATYFGVAQKAKEAAAYMLNFKLSAIKRARGNTDNASNPLIYIGNKCADATLNLGGYFGAIALSEEALPINNLQTNGEDALSTFVNFKLETEEKVGNLRVGGIFGFNQGNSTIDFNATDATMNLSLFVDGEVKTLNAGGLIGCQSGLFSVSGYKQIDFGVVGIENNEAKNDTLFKSNKNDFKQDYVPATGDERITPVSVKTAYIGGAVGYSNAELSISSKDLIINPISDNKVNNICVKASDVLAIGSVVGKSDAANLSIMGKIIASTEFKVSDDVAASIYAGGIVGNIDVGTITSGRKYEITGEGNNLIHFNGAVYSNVKNLVFGGILGQIDFANANDSLSLKNTAFGGVAKIYGNKINDGNVTAGGSIGSVNNKAEENIKANVEMAENYNYGDVFVEYDNSDDSSDESSTLGKKDYNLESYNFGGLIGDLSNVKYNIHNNYTITTSHNAKYQTISNTANALFGKSVLNDANDQWNSNYYNHAVVLANDEHGIDIGYVNGSYSNGYEAAFPSGGQQNSARENNNTNNLITSIISNKLGNTSSINKLNPGTVNVQNYRLKALNNETAKPFNGIRYYTISNDFKGQIQDVDANDNQTFDLENVAIIGDGNQIKYNKISGNINNNMETSALIKSLKGYSFAAGFALDVDVKYEKIDGGDTLDYVAPVVEAMYDNTIIYAINVRGTFDVGGEKTRTVSGIVGNLYSGRIFDCSTDLDITYRAGGISEEGESKKAGNVYGIAKTDDEEAESIGRIIENTYASGSIKTLISSNVYAFTNASSKTTLNNCYAINKLDLHDYTNQDDVNSGDKGIFGTAGTKNNCYADYDSLNYFKEVVKKNENRVVKVDAAVKTHSDLMNADTTEDGVTTYNPSVNFTGATNKWVCDYDFNYGYPTLKYPYLKTSSYTYLKESQTKRVRLGDKAFDSAKKIADENLYDNYIIENEYVRLENGQKPEEASSTKEAKSYYYIIPNLAILSKMADVGNDGLNGNFILRYDIDIANKVTGKDNTEYDDAKNIGNFTGKFDGQGNTIRHLDKTLFASINKTQTENSRANEISTQVINLRLTDATIITSLFAKEIENALVSNITLSGSLANNSAKIIGGLAETAKNSYIHAVTNMIDINVAGGDNLTAGGIVGKLINSQMKFCSNYGPINARAADGKTLMLGGLVGEVADEKTTNETLSSSTIDYSYNSTSVLGNYATQSAVVSTKGTFYTGGLVGKLNTGAISNSYNAGMIKSGNKSNGSYNSDGSVNGKSYAGGIVGYIAGGSITGCYNEGTVEALGQNPTTEWDWEYNGQKLTKLDITEAMVQNINLVLKQTSQQNVFAYGIGYKESNSTITNSFIRLNERQNDYSTIYANGSAAKINTIIFKDALNNILSDGQIAGLLSEGKDDDITQYTINRTHTMSSLSYVMGGIFGVIFGNIWQDQWYVYNYYKFRSEFSYQLPTLNNENISVRSVDSLGLPKSYVLKLSNKQNLTVTRTLIWDGAGGTYYNKLKRPPFVSELLSYQQKEVKGLSDRKDNDCFKTDVEDKDNNYLLYEYCMRNVVINYSRYVYGDKDENKTMISNDVIPTKENKNEIVFASKNDIKTACLSQEKEEAENIKDTTIAGKKFKFANQNNMKNAFMAGIYVVNETYTSSELPFIDNIDAYSIQVESLNENKNQSISAKINRVYRDENANATVIDYYVFDKEIIDATFKIKVSLDYTQTIEESLENLKYYYNDEKSIAVELFNLNFTPLKGYKLSYGNNMYCVVDNIDNNTMDKNINYIDGGIVRLAKESYVTENEPKDGDDYIYLVYANEDVDAAGNGKFVFVPNATLTDARGNRFTVNQIKDSENNNVFIKSDNFAKDVEIVIQKLLEAPYYSRYESEESDWITINDENGKFSESYNKISEEIYLNGNSITIGEAGGLQLNLTSLSPNKYSAHITSGNNQIEASYFNFKLKKKNDDTLVKYLESISSLSSFNFDIEDIEPDVLYEVSVEVFSTRLARQANMSESFDYQLVLEEMDDNRSKYYVDASFDLATKKTVINSYGKLYTKKQLVEDKNILLFVSKEEFENENHEKICRYNYSVCNTLILTKIVNENTGKTSYISYYDAKGLPKTEQDTYYIAKVINEEGEEDIVITSNVSSEEYLAIGAEDGWQKYKLKDGDKLIFIRETQNAEKNQYEMKVGNKLLDCLESSENLWVFGIHQDSIPELDIKNVYIPHVGKDSSASNLSEFIGNSFDALPEVNYFGDELLKISSFEETGSGTKEYKDYIYVNGAYNVLPELNYTGKLLCDIYDNPETKDNTERPVSSVRVPNISYKSASIPAYDSVSFELNYSNMIIDDDTIKSKYVQNDKNVEVYLRDKNESRLNCKAFISWSNGEDGECGEFHVTDTSAICDIILNQDISFIEGLSSKHNNLNIIGNGYSIKTNNNNPFINKLLGDVGSTSFMNNINILSEVYGQQSFLFNETSQENMNVILKNVSLYGSIINSDVSYEKGGQTYTKSAVFNDKVIIDGLKSYLSINACKNDENTFNLFADIAEFKNLEIGGIITLVNGKDGAKGGKDKDGTQGGNGMSLSLLLPNGNEKENIVTAKSSGIIIKGLGGNGGAGGYVVEKGKVKNGGGKGECSNVTGFEETEIGITVGKNTAGLTGYSQRYTLSTFVKNSIEFNQDSCNEVDTTYTKNEKYKEKKFAFGVGGYKVTQDGVSYKVTIDHKELFGLIAYHNKPSL